MSEQASNTVIMTMKLTDLPRDILTDILFTVMNLCWSGIDFVLCNRVSLEVLYDYAQWIFPYLCLRPWNIWQGTMHAEAENVIHMGYDSLHHGVRYLETGRVKKLELFCSTIISDPDSLHFHESQIDDWALECVLGSWPGNKVVLVYDMT